MRFVVLILASFICNVYSSESSEEFANFVNNKKGAEFMKNILRMAYEKDKLDTIYDWILEFIEDKDEDINATLIGTQNIYGTNGDVKEIRTVELFIPKLEALNKLKLNSDDEDDDDDTSVDELRRNFEALAKIGFEGEISYVGYDKRGNVAEKVHFNRDLVYTFEDGVHYLNKSAVVRSAKEVEDAITSLKTKNELVSVLNFDSNSSKYLKESSILVPELITYLMDVEGAPSDEMLQKALSGVAEISLEHSGDTLEICRSLVQFMEEKFPDMIFHVVFDDRDTNYVTKDVMIKVAYELTGFDSPNDVYNIYGVKK